MAVGTPALVGVHQRLDCLNRHVEQGGGGHLEAGLGAMLECFPEMALVDAEAVEIRLRLALEPILALPATADKPEPIGVVALAGRPLSPTLI